MNLSEDFLSFEHFESNELNYFLFFAVLGFFVYILYSNFYSENILEEVERKLIEMKESIAFYTNRMLLQSNMEGDAIKNIQVL